MPITIDQEAREKSRKAIDFEKQGDRFKTENNYFTFPDPNISTIEKYLFFLLKNSKEVDFDDSSYKYRPDYLSYDQYGTPNLDKLLMFVNGIRTVEDFTNLKTVYVPSIESITVILSDNYDPSKDIDDLDAVGW